MQPTNSKKVCIIGAGPRGLVTARHISAAQNAEITVFEAKDDIGGLWFVKDTKKEEPADLAKIDNYCKLYGCFQDSLYDTLITDTPYFLMEFKDLGMRDVDENLPLFVSITKYKQYLDAYADKFNLRRHIQFNTLIKAVRLYQNLSVEEKSNVRIPRKFVVTTIDAKGDSLSTGIKYHSFDYVVVTGGQYNVPYMPQIPGADQFTGNIIHHKNFGSPNSPIYRDKKIVIIGASNAASDMLIQLFSNDVKRVQDCRKVTICSRRVAHIRNSEDFRHLIAEEKLSVHEGTVERFKAPNIVCFSDGTEEEVDTVVYATGYKLKFPYFDFKNDKIIDHDENENRGVFFGPLYKKFISIREPNLIFVGYMETPFVVNILPELQAIVARHIIEGRLALPSQEEMLQNYNEEVKAHLTYIGNLGQFYKTDLSVRFPKFPNSFEHNEWVYYMNWVKQVQKESNEEKAQQYFNLILRAKEIILKFKRQGNFLQCKNFDYHTIYPKEFRNTSEFV